MNNNYYLKVCDKQYFMSLMLVRGGEGGREGGVCVKP